MRIQRLTPLALIGAAFLTSSAQAQCPSDDTYGPNTSCNDAVEFTTQFGLVDDLAATSIFPDYWKLPLAPGQRITVNIYPEVSSVILDLALLPNCGTPIIGSGTNQNMAVVYENPSSTTPVEVIVRVRRSDTAGPCVNYDMEWFTDNGDCPAADTFEPNDTCAGAALLPGSSIAETGLTASLGDDDYYEISLDPGASLDAEILFPHAAGDLDLYLYSSCGTQIQLSNGTSNHEDVSVTNNTGVTQDYRLRVYYFPGGVGSGCNEYSLYAEKITPGCPQDDTFEPNDTCAGATSIEIGYFENLFVSKTDEDFYVGDILAGDSIFVSIDFTHANGDVDLWLYDQANCGTSLVSSRSTTDGEAVTWTNNTGVAVTIAIRVEYFTNDTGCNTYDMSVGVSQGNPSYTVCLPNPNSTGSGSFLNVIGSNVVSANTVLLTASGVPPSQFGIFLNSPGMTFSAPANSEGLICINQGGIGRFNRAGEIVQASPNGNVDLGIDLTDMPRPNSIASVAPGDVWYFQFWHRDFDSMGDNTSNFSSAVAVPFE